MTAKLEANGHWFVDDDLNHFEVWLDEQGIHVQKIIPRETDYGTFTTEPPINVPFDEFISSLTLAKISHEPRPRKSPRKNRPKR